jgi:DNA polymerase I
VPAHLLVVDLLNVAYRAHHSRLREVERAGEQLRVPLGVVRLTHELVFRYAITNVVFAFDAPGANFRERLAEGYKVGRSSRPAELDAQLPRTREALEVLGYEIYEMTDYEADDVIASLVRRGEKIFDHVFVATADHDLLAVVSERTTLLDLAAGLGRVTAWTPELVRARYGLEPVQLTDWKALLGDRSDTYAGVAGLTRRQASWLLRRFGSLDGIYAALPTIRLQRLRARLAEGREQAYRAHALARLVDDLPLHLDRRSGRVGAVSRDVAASYLVRLGLGELVSRLPRRRAA